MLNFRKVLILIVSLTVVLPLGSASADTGPKPTMNFSYQSETPGPLPTILSGSLLECNQPDCGDAAPLKELGPQRFSCQSDSCSALAYSFSPYHRLEIQFSDGKTRQSNIFQTAQFNSVYKVTVRPDDLLVESQFNLDLFSPTTYLLICGCLVGILAIAIVLIIIFIRRSRKKK